MEFFRTIKKSIYDRAFYAAAKDEPSGKPLKYYSLLIVCMAILIAIPLYASIWLGVSYVKKNGDLRTRILSVYPNELVLTFQNGRMASNVEEPYSIPMPAEFNVKAPENLIVINTSGSVALTDFDRYNTSAILGSDAIWIHDVQKDKIEIQRFDKFSKGAFVLNKQKVSEWVGIALKVGKIVGIVLLISLPFLLFAFLWLGYLAYLLFGALVIWLMAKLRKVELTYGQAYKLGLYLLTLPIFYSVLTFGPLWMFRVPFGFTLILAALAYANFGPSKALAVETPSAIVPVPNTEKSNPVEPKK